MFANTEHKTKENKSCYSKLKLSREMSNVNIIELAIKNNIARNGRINIPDHTIEKEAVNLILKKGKEKNINQQD